MDLDHIKALIETMAASDLAEMEISEGGWTLRLRRHGAPVAAVAARAPLALSDAVAEAGGDLQAPMAGVIHLRAAPGAPPFVCEGETVQTGATLCLIEAMKVFNTVRAEREFTVAAILVESGSEVEAGQVLMRLA